MPKRSAVTYPSSDDNGADDDFTYISDDSEAYEPAPKKAKRSGKGALSTTKATGSVRKTKPKLLSNGDKDLVSVKHGPTAPHSHTRHVIDAGTAEGAAKALLEWYAGVHESRGMPWRKPFNPEWTNAERGQRAYEVWVSEIMLQQTQVATVIPYYNRWMEKFPTLKDLGESSLDTVHALWKGLGYYSRGTRLLEGAKKVLANRKLNGCLPTTAATLQSDVPGIGRYSAGAIASIAYGERAPVLDGNVNRLLSRFLALHAPPKAKTTLDILWNGAVALVEAPSAAKTPGDLNQALIELGSTVCKPAEPSCRACPIRPWCGAYALSQSHVSTARVPLDGTQPKPTGGDTDVPDIEEMPPSCALCAPLPISVNGTIRPTIFPMRAEKKKAREETDAVYVVEWRGHHASQGSSNRWFTLVKRPPGGLLAGLEEFPTDANIGTAGTADSVELLARTAVQRLLASPLDPSPPNIVNTYQNIPPNSRKRGKEAGIFEMPKPELNEISIGSSNPRIVHVQSAGEVLHVFSHIRKTYRLHWVLLAGGSENDDQPPMLKAFWEPLQATAPKATRDASVKDKKHKPKKNKAYDEDEDDAEVVTLPAPTVRWTRMEDVADSNIGTGVVKMWDKVRTLWEAC